MLCNSIFNVLVFYIYVSLLFEFVMYIIAVTYFKRKRKRWIQVSRVVSSTLLNEYTFTVSYYKNTRDIVYCLIVFATLCINRYELISFHLPLALCDVDVFHLFICIYILFYKTAILYIIIPYNYSI